MLSDKEKIQTLIINFYSLENFLLENLEHLDFLDIPKIKYSLRIIKLWLEEIKSKKKSIFVFGKMSSGKSSFLNNLLNNQGDLEILPTSTKTETRLIIRVEHIENKPYALIILSKKHTTKIEDKFKKYHIRNEDTLKIPLTEEEDIKNFHEFIRLNSFDPLKFIKTDNALDNSKSVRIFFPFKKRFKDFVFFDTPGLSSSFSVTDNEVYNSFLFHSLIIWCINGSEPQMSDAVIQIEKNKEHLRKIKPNRLIFLTTHYDLLVGRDKLTEIITEKGISRNEAKEWLKKKAKGHIDDVLKENTINSYLNFRFIDLKRNKDNTQNCLNDIETKIANKFKSIEIDMAMDLNQTIIKFLKDINSKIEKQINNFSNKIEKLKNELKIEQEKNNLIKIKKLKEKSKEIVEFQNNIRIKIKQIIQEILNSTNINNYNVNVNELSEYLSNIKIKICNNFRMPESSVNSVTFNFTKYLFKIKLKQKNNWFKKGCKKGADFILPVDTIKHFRLTRKKNKFKKGIKRIALSNFDVEQQLSNNFINIKEFFDKEINKDADIKFSNFSDDKSAEIEKVESQKNNLKQIIKNIKKKEILLKDLKESLKEAIELEIKKWEEPIHDLNSNKKLIAFLDLYRNIKYCEELGNVEDINEQIIR